MSTSYILNICVLPTKNTDDYESFSNLGAVDEQVQSIGQLWGMFRNYALINQDQVILFNVILLSDFDQGFVVKLFEKTWEEGCNIVTAYHQGEKYENYNVSLAVSLI